MKTMTWTGNILIPVLFFGLLASVAQAQQTASIVYGSYSSLERAEASRSLLEQKLLRSLDISSTKIRDTTYFRVIGPLDENIQRLRTRLAQVQADVEPNAWLLIGDSDAMPVREIITSEANPKDSPAKAKPITAHPDSNSAGNGPLNVAEVPDESSPTVSGSFANTNEETGVDRVTDPLTNIIRIQPVSTGGVDATTEPLVLPKYDDKNLNMKIDGRLDEHVWSEVTGYDNMTILDPDTLEVPLYSTVTKLVYTDKGLYVGIWNEQPVDKLLSRLTKRDEMINRDGNHFTLDTSGEGLYGFWFDVALGGAIADGKVLPEMQYSREWDGPWYGNSVATDDGYTTEMFLPWSMMSMPDADQQRTMGFYTSRKVAYLDERWGWPSLPMTGSKFMSALQPVVLQNVNPRQQYALFPFTSANYNNMDSETSYRTGVDISWRPSSNVQITASLNPDFGTVESDNVVVNLTAEETFFPEKRLFFLEGNEIFVTTPRSSVFSPSSSGGSGARATKSSFNPTPTTLVNTRRIGGQAPDPDIPAGIAIPDIELGKPTELMGAFKITGQKNQLRYGVLSAFEEDQRFYGTDSDDNAVRLDQDGRDFGVLRFLYENSNNGRKGIGWISTVVTNPDGDAYVHGIDTHYLSPSSRWNWDSQFIYSDVDNVEGYGGFTDISYFPSRGIFHKISFDYLDDTLDVTDFGFVRRNDVIVGRYFYMHKTSDLTKLRERSNSWIVNQEYNTEGQVVRSGIFWRTGWTFHNRMQLRTELAYFPKRWDDLNSEGNGSFRTEDRWTSEIGVGTDSSKKLSISFAAGMRQEELGDWTKTTKGGFTYKPNDRLSMDLDFSYFRHDGWLLYQQDRLFTTYKASNWQPSLSLDVFLTVHQQLRFTLQWAGIRASEQDFYQIPEGDGYLIPYDKGPDEPTDDFTISRTTSQLRYRWEIAPLSDLFIVYTRGSNRETRRHDDFEDLFLDSITDPLIDMFVIKLRYRFGS